MSENLVSGHRRLRLLELLLKNGFAEALHNPSALSGQTRRSNHPPWIRVPRLSHGQKRQIRAKTVLHFNQDPDKTSSRSSEAYL